MAVPLNQTDRPEGAALDAIDSYARGRMSITDAKNVIAAVVACGRWEGHEAVKARLERLLEAGPAGWADVAHRWREVYQIPDPLA